MKYQVTEHVTQKEKDSVYQELLKYNMAYSEERKPKDLAVFVDDDKQTRIGALIGKTHGNWLTIEYLWVNEENRCQDVSVELLKRAEEEAIARGCHYVFLSTFRFQAQEFYENLGYEEVYALHDYPYTGKRFFYTKILRK